MTNTHHRGVVRLPGGALVLVLVLVLSWSCPGGRADRRHMVLCVLSVSVCGLPAAVYSHTVLLLGSHR